MEKGTDQDQSTENTGGNGEEKAKKDDQQLDKKTSEDTNTDDNSSVFKVPAENKPAFKAPGKVTPEFKAPSFVIPSKKKVQGSNKLAASPQVKSQTKSDEENKQKDDGGKNKDETEKSSVSNNEADGRTEAGTKTSSGRLLSPAEQLKIAQNPFPYNAPEWGGMCEEKFSFEVIKNGAIVDNVELNTKQFHVIGRLPSCDVPMEHPSLSRYHAVVQYSVGSSAFPKGWYLYDLDSTHGTWLNKNKVPPQQFHRLRVDYVLKFGGSTRLFILQGPSEDRDEESELSVKEMKEQREKQKKEIELLQLAEKAEAERKAELLAKQQQDRGCSWGIGDDAEAEEEEQDGENPFAVTENEELYLDDPKKSLNGFFEREGCDPPEYEFTETGYGKWKCSVELPVDSPTGAPLRAEVVVSGKKKEAVIACALEACRLLDRLGLLRKSTHESRTKKRKNWEEEDFYDSDEDLFFDRTGTIEKKRQYRKSKFGKEERVTETYDTLLDKHKKLMSEIEDIEAKLELAKQQAAEMDNDEVDALDAYMSAIKSGMMDTKTKMKLKRQLMELKQEEQKLRKLVNLAKPASLPELKVPVQKTSALKPSLSSGVGKIKGPGQGIKGPGRPPVSVQAKITVDEDVEFEVEEEEEELDELNADGKVSAVPDVGRSKKESVHTVAKPLKNFTESSKKQDHVPQSKVKGPSLSSVLEKLQNESDEMETEDSKEAKVTKPKSTSTVGPSKRNVKSLADTLTELKKQKIDEPVSFEEAADPDYAVWLPPKNQMGDGKTHLNEKYGY